MVKVGILQADSPIAGEIIRILMLHPETEIVNLFSPANIGRNVSTVHHGLIGETQMNFSDKINIEDLDLLIVDRKSELTEKILKQKENLNKLKVVATSKDDLKGLFEESIEIGLSEINRKSLVRGAQIAYLPSPAIVASLIALAPLAQFLLLNSDIDITVALPEDIRENTDVPADIEELEKQLKLRQVSFKGNIKLKIEDSGSKRGATTSIFMKNSLAIDEIEKIYDQIYDDHHFTFITRNNVDYKEVEGTHKTLVSLDKPDTDTLHIKVIYDARMRGGAGDVVHILNLFFGLHELTGLHLKPSIF